jgi:hypothetical protein
MYVKDVNWPMDAHEPRSPTFNLKVGETIFPVNTKDLLTISSLFQRSPSLLDSGEYEVLTRVPPPIFEIFWAIAQNGQVTPSTRNLTLLWLLAAEFEAHNLSVTFTSLLEKRQHHWRPPPMTYLGEGELYPFAFVNDSGPRVTIRVKGRLKTYELLKSLDEIWKFGRHLVEAKEKDIVIDGIEGRDRLIEKAVEAVYSNAVANIRNCDSKVPFLVLTLWELRVLLENCCINAVTYCLNRMHKIAPTGFDKARLLLLSQCVPGTFIPLPRAHMPIVHKAVALLQIEKNGRMKDAGYLLQELKSIPRYHSILRTVSGCMGRTFQS